MNILTDPLISGIIGFCLGALLAILIMEWDGKTPE